jgi:TatD DNase family protein
MRLIDTHCHLPHGRLRQQLPGVLERAREAGLCHIICATSAVEEAIGARNIARAEPDVTFTVGTHPHYAKDFTDALLAQTRDLLADKHCVALGEIGLDYHYDFSPPEAQQAAFDAQLALARELACPIVIHTREAFDDTLAMIRNSGVDTSRVIFHSFTEDEGPTRQVLDLGAMISYSGIATFKRTDSLRDASKLVPDDRILIETDAPFLSPEPVRKMHPNEPANVAHVATCLAAVRETTPGAFAELTTQNAIRAFGLDIAT